MHSISINSLSFSQRCRVTFHTTPNGILLHFFTLGAGLNIRHKKGVRFSTFFVIIIVYRAVHQLGHHGVEEFPLMEILLIIIQHITCRLVADFQVLPMQLISVEEITVLYVLALLSCRAPTIICQHNSGLIILDQNIAVNTVTLILHKVLGPHH